MSVQGIDQMLGELRAMSASAAGQSAPAEKVPEGADFASVLKASLDQVNQMQLESQAKQQAFEAGSPDANLQDVMVSL